MPQGINRRRLLCGAAATLGAGLLPVRRALAGPVAGDAVKFVFVVNYGGWDPTRVFATEFSNGNVDMEPGAGSSSAGGLCRHLPPRTPLPTAPSCVIRAPVRAGSAHHSLGRRPRGAPSRATSHPHVAPHEEKYLYGLHHHHHRRYPLSSSATIPMTSVVPVSPPPPPWGNRRVSAPSVRRARPPAAGPLPPPPAASPGPTAAPAAPAPEPVGPRPPWPRGPDDAPTTLEAGTPPRGRVAAPPPRRLSAASPRVLRPRFEPAPPSGHDFYDPTATATATATATDP